MDNLIQIYLDKDIFINEKTDKDSTAAINCISCALVKVLREFPTLVSVAILNNDETKIYNPGELTVVKKTPEEIVKEAPVCNKDFTLIHKNRDVLQNWFNHRGKAILYTSKHNLSLDVLHILECDDQYDVYEKLIKYIHIC